MMSTYYNSIAFFRLTCKKIGILYKNTEKLVKIIKQSRMHDPRAEYKLPYDLYDALISDPIGFEKCKKNNLNNWEEVTKYYL